MPNTVTSEREAPIGACQCGGHDGGGPLLLSAERAAGLLGIGARFFWTLHTTGQLGPEPIKLGRRLLWSRFDLERWVLARCPHRERWAGQESNQTGP
ncbi:MAG: hypothetical protein RBS72_18080 [Sedimentisphaerales bacterium]|jgi:predicted DNA-binding transcriptional regulator AlpA|nr:hypothetical protein [Sedimentisphaerales bacterium]HNY78456.1 hypothetical protein [Sedimentisphaerales bacterium]HOC63657.1 hypothetical protein [Sedimentisphaerales bacterium]HOH64404.1 hypothetical protein [Sedimentisphaerales bacterium]HPY49297.1 hypothetical protein [Sedimentisphaerales bacterium]